MVFTIVFNLIMQQVIAEKRDLLRVHTFNLRKDLFVILDVIDVFADIFS